MFTSLVKIYNIDLIESIKTRRLIELIFVSSKVCTSLLGIKSVFDTANLPFLINPFVSYV